MTGVCCGNTVFCVRKELNFYIFCRCVLVFIVPFINEKYYFRDITSHQSDRWFDQWEGFCRFRYTSVADGCPNFKFMSHRILSLDASFWFCDVRVLQDVCAGGWSPSLSVIVIRCTLPTTFRSFSMAYATLCTAMLCIALYACTAQGIFVLIYCALTFPYLTFLKPVFMRVACFNILKTAFGSKNVLIGLIRFPY
jgi:hypothetical protein